jgi:hypothetical protein
MSQTSLVIHSGGEESSEYRDERDRYSSMSNVVNSYLEWPLLSKSNNLPTQQIATARNSKKGGSVDPLASLRLGDRNSIAFK